jgi:hypothetical protein
MRTDVRLDVPLGVNPGPAGNPGGASERMVLEENSDSNVSRQDEDVEPLLGGSSKSAFADLSIF